MKVRTTIAGTALSVRLTTLCWGAVTLVALVAVSACSGSNTSSPNVPSFSPSVTISGTGTSRATVPASAANTAPGSGGTTSGTPGVSSSTPDTQIATPVVTVTVTATVPPSQIPAAAPVTGGGGTAGLQDGALFGLGAAAILIGAGSIAYRRWLTRGR
jgi:hypothetical protein